MKHITLIGDSHLRALQLAVKPFQNQQGLVWQVCITFDPPFAPPFSESEGAIRINPHLLKEFGKTQAIVCSIGGNHHNVMGLVEHPQAFDFCSPELPELPLRQDRQFIPYSLVRAQLTFVLEKNVFRYLREIQNISKVQVFYIESPPPASSEHIKKNAAPFSEMLTSYDVAPLFLRRKLWKLHSKLIEEFCDENGIRFLHCPKEAMEADGTLVEELANSDPTHGNEAYGKLQLEHLRSALLEHFANL